MNLHVDRQDASRSISFFDMRPLLRGSDYYLYIKQKSKEFGVANRYGFFKTSDDSFGIQVQKVEPRQEPLDVLQGGDDMQLTA